MPTLPAAALNTSLNTSYPCWFGPVEWNLNRVTYHHSETREHATTLRTHARTVNRGGTPHKHGKTYTCTLQIPARDWHVNIILKGGSEGFYRARRRSRAKTFEGPWTSGAAHPVRLNASLSKPVCRAEVVKATSFTRAEQPA